MEVDQQALWHSLAPAVTTPYILHTAGDQWAALFDLSTLDLNDHLLLTVEIELLGPRPGETTEDKSRVEWALSDEYSIHFEVNGNRRYLIANDAPVGPQHILLVEPAAGPWRSRLIYKQTRGFDKPIRYLIW